MLYLSALTEYASQIQTQKLFLPSPPLIKMHDQIKMSSFPWANVNNSWEAVGNCWGVLSDAYLLSSEFTVLFIRFLNIYTHFPFQ